MIELSSSEEFALRVLRYTFQSRCVQMLLLCLLILGAVRHWMMGKRAKLRTGRSHIPTLYDPQRLRAMLNTFTTSTRSGQSERHRTESLCRTLLEAMTGVTFPKARPKWLTNPVTKRCLELDMYNEKNRLAFEYDGAQHDVYTPHYHSSTDHFEYRRLLDKLKGELCRDAGVRLIRISWSDVSCKDEARTARYLEHLLRHNGIPFRSILQRSA